jgi:3-phenylpropionate/trans-cinnamate dioxygenase ferredoxin reductase subunit
MSRPVIIIGASMGGLRTAETLRRSGYTGRVVVIGEELHAPYNRPPLSKEVLAADVHHAAVAFPQSADIADVEWILGRRVVRVDLEREVVIDDLGVEHPYAALVVATGLRSRRFDLPAKPTSGTFVIRSLDDAIALRASIFEGVRVVVYGAGFIGCEVAATVRKLGADVTVIGKPPLPLLRPLGAALAADIQKRQEAQGVRFFMNSTITKVSGGDRVESVLLDSGVELYTQVLIEAIGSEPNTELLAAEDVDLTDGIATDSSLRVLRSTGEPWPNVFAVGDVARFPIPKFSAKPRRVEHWNIPTEMARKVGKTIALLLANSAPDAGAAGGATAGATATAVEAEALVAELAKPFAPIPSFWSDQFDTSLLAYGLLDGADDIRLLEGEVGGDCVYGYFVGETMVGVCGVGMRSRVMSYRNQVGLLQ